MADVGRSSMGNLGQYASMSVGESRGRSMAELVGDVIGDVQSIMRSEVQLARVETREEVGKAARASKLLVTGALVALFSAAFALLAVFEALCLVVAPWLSALIVAVILGVVAAGVAAAGRAQWAKFNAVPPKTAQTVKENVEWAQNRTK